MQHRLADFPHPTLVLAGELDASTTPQVMTGLAGRVARARYQELPATPHMQTLERPDLVTEALDGFLPSGRDSGRDEERGGEPAR